MNIEHRQLVSLSKELKTSVKLIHYGLAELQQISILNDNLYLPFFLLSSGYERLMKCMMCLQYLKEYNEFPNFKFIKKYGHNLVKLKKHILDKCFLSPDDKKVSDVNIDYAFLSNDMELDVIFQILSDFAENDRYYNLNVVVSDDRITSDFQESWEKNVQNYYLTKLELNLKFNSKTPEELEKDNLEVFTRINSEIIKCLEKFTRALMRQFKEEKLGKEALSYQGYFLHFLTLQDENLGKSKYPNNIFKVMGT